MADLSLLFQLRADNAQAKATMDDTRTAVTQLRTQFGKDLTGMQSLARTAIADIGENINSFVGQRIPLIGGAFVRVTSNLKGFNDELRRGGPQTEKLAQQIDAIAKASGKTTTEVSRFLTTFVRLQGQTARNEAAFKAFGGSVDLIGNKTAKFLPQLEQAGTSLAAVSSEAVTAGSAVGAMAGPITIAVVALAALAIGGAAAAKQLFDLTKQAADAQGRMFDLAQQTGLQVETLSALEVVAKTTGGEIGNLTQAIVSFQRKLDEAQDPLSKSAEQFRKFNIATTDTESALRQTFAALAAMPPGFAQTNLAAEFFGARGGKQFLAILKETNGNLDQAIKKLREMGILISEEDARAADKFNDELALLEFQLRALTFALARDLIPAMTDVVRGMGDLAQAVRPVLSLFGALAGPVVRSVGEGLRNLGIIVRTLTGDYNAFAESIRRAREEREIKPIDIPAAGPVPLPAAPTPQQTTSDAVNQAEAVVAGVKRNVAIQSQALAEMAQQGRRSREQEAAETIEFNRKVLVAEQQRIDALLAKKEQEFRALDKAQKDRGEALNRDTDAHRAIAAEVTKLQQERLDKENAFEVSARAIRSKVAKESADARRNDVRNSTDLIANELDHQIKTVEARIKRGEQSEDAGLTFIEQLEQAKADARIEGLEEQRRIGFLSLQEQADLNAELQRLVQDRDRLGDEQAERRLDRERAAGQRTLDIILANIETLLRLEQIVGQRRIDTLRQFADLQVLTEEEAAKRILQIRLDLIDDEIETLKAKLKAAGSLADKDERVRAQAELNNQIKILTEERKGIEADGFREIDEGRQRDLENERRYARELQSIRERINDIQRETARTVIDLMILNHARRRDIIRAQTELELKGENDRHQRELDGIEKQRQENAASKKTQEEKLEAEKEFNRQREAEAERHRLAMEEIEGRGKQDEEDADAFGRIRLGKEDLKEFASQLESSIVPLNQILTDSFLQVAEAIGSVVEQWVLLGETGPAVGRKILAAALANLAKEAAINAVKELALGFAMLFINPADSAAHFTSAALWGSIAGGAAIAGRGVAGDLFKQKTPPGGSAGSGGSSGGPDALNPIIQGRNQQQTITIILRPDEGAFGRLVRATVVEDIGNGGVIREVINSDGR